MPINSADQILSGCRDVVFQYFGFSENEAGSGFFPDSRIPSGKSEGGATFSGKPKSQEFGWFIPSSVKDRGWTTREGKGPARGGGGAFP
jgi:hypothetical protein